MIQSEVIVHMAIFTFTANAGQFANTLLFR